MSTRWLDGRQLCHPGMCVDEVSLILSLYKLRGEARYGRTAHREKA
jgi:hypothetical protein